MVARCSLGWFGVLSTARGVLRTFSPCPTERGARATLVRALRGAELVSRCGRLVIQPAQAGPPKTDQEAARAEAGPRPRRILASTVKHLRSFFDGKRETFKGIPLDMRGLGRFARAVYTAARAVRYGETVSYGEMAAHAGRPGAARAVGQVMARNPFFPVVPCHRVIGHDGRMCGFGGPGGIRRKKRLLAVESG
ncbi:MAG: methylated-DNA--[protein]-cysteine S-methyltransferase [Planctomycetota bacterium]|nr:methylated-DNA--[protein]-cysteine S-methyltransferase [Planctomycetota bacterium]